MFQNLTAAEATRLGVYILGALVGAVFAIYGMVHGDGALIATGLTLMGSNGLAAKNVTRTAPPLDDGTDEFLADLGTDDEDETLG